MSDDRQAKIENRAREIWQREGCPEGRAAEHWRIAESEIAAETAAAEKPAKATGAKPAKAAGATKSKAPASTRVKPEAKKTDEGKKTVKKKK